MRAKRSKLKTKREVEVAKATLNRLDAIIKHSKTVDEARFCVMLMREELDRTEEFIEFEDYKRNLEYFNSQVTYFMTCRWGPCHLCHHLFNGCYEPTQEIVEEIKKRWTNSHE